MDLGIITRYLNNPLLRSPAGVMKICLAISFLFHTFLLMGFQKAFPSLWVNPELRTYKVEIIRPPTEDLDKEDILGSVADSLEHEKDTVTEDSDTISLDTKDERYLSYAGMIKTKILRHWNYPDKAKLSLLEGEVMVIFSLVRDGKMTNINIESGSGYEILDNEVLRAINACVPFPAFPESINVDRLNIRANFAYRLSSGKRDN